MVGLALHGDLGATRCGLAPPQADDDLFGSIRRQTTTPPLALSVLDAVTATICGQQQQQHVPAPTAYFGALMAMFERPDMDDRLAEGVTFLLSTLIQSGRLSGSVLIARFDDVAGILVRALQAHAGSAICARHLLLCLARAVSYLDRGAAWASANAVRVLQALLVFAVDPRPKVRRTAQAGVVALLKALAPNVPAVVAECVRLSCQRELDSPDLTIALHLTGLLQSTVTFLPLTTTAALIEMFHAKATASNSALLKLRLVQCLTTLFEATGPAPTPSFVETILSALQSMSMASNDADAAVAMFRAVTAGCQLLHRISASAAARLVPRYVQALPDALLHTNAAVAAQAAASMTALLSSCIDRSADPDLVASLLARAASLLSYRFKPRWPACLPIVSAGVAAVAQRPDAAALAAPLLAAVDAVLALADDAVSVKERQAVADVMASCVAHLGAPAVLAQLPIAWPAPDQAGALQRFLASSRAWLLPMIRSAPAPAASAASLRCFQERLLPGALALSAWAGTAAAAPVERQALNAVVLQIWDCFPAFCAGAGDADPVLGELAPALCAQLEACADARPAIARGLGAVLAGPIPFQAEPVAKVVLPALCTTVTLTAPDKRRPVLDCIKAWCGVASPALVNRMFKTVLKRLLAADDADARHHMMDLCNAMCLRLDDGNRQRLLAVIAQTVSSGDGDVFAQKRAYQCWRQLMESALVADWPDAFARFSAALPSAAPGARRARILCIPPLCGLIPDAQIAPAIAEVLGECILAVKEANFKVRDAAYGTIVALGERVPISDYVMMLLGGLAGTSHMQSASVLSIARFLFEKRAVVSKEIVAQILETILLLFQSKSQEVMKSVLGFVKVAVVSLTPDLLRPHLKGILSGLELWANQNKNRFRQRWRMIIERMLRRFAYEELLECIPVAYQPFLNNIQKAKKKGKERKPKTGLSYENILNEDDEEDVEEKAPVQNAQKPADPQVQLVNPASEPLDLLDLSHRNIATGASRKKKRSSSEMELAARPHPGKGSASRTGISKPRSRVKKPRRT